jgi:hypothetical protein
VENHVGICAACAGALKTKWCATYKKVRALSMDLKNKSWLASMSAATSSSVARASQDTEDRRLYDGASSNASSLNNVPAGGKDPDMRMELVEMHPGTRISIVEAPQPRIIHIPPRSSRGL